MYIICYNYNNYIIYTAEKTSKIQYVKCFCFGFSYLPVKELRPGEQE